MAESGSEEADSAARLERLDDPLQYRYLSAEELRTFLDPGDDWTIADLGSGTGFFTDELAPVVGTAIAIDINDAMHRRYRSNGVPTNVIPLKADVGSLPLADDCLDGAVSIRTFHHGVAGALDEIARVLNPGARLVVVDWSAAGAGDRDRGRHPERYVDAAAAQAALIDAGFSIDETHERRETFVVVGALRGDRA